METEDILERTTKKNLILKEMMILFFKYYDINIDVINLDFVTGHTVYSHDKIPPKINKIFHDKFELGKMELNSVIHCENGDWIYQWDIKLSPAEQRIKLWLDASIPIHVPDPIMFQDMPK